MIIYVSVCNQTVNLSKLLVLPISLNFSFEISGYFIILNVSAYHGIHFA